MPSFERAVFGNRGGSHQLLESTLPANSPVLDTLRFLVDRPGGHIDAGASWSPYWGCQGLLEWWVVWRGEEDPGAPRKNMVEAHVVLVPASQCGDIDDLDPVLRAVGYQSSGQDRQDLESARALVGAVVEQLVRGRAPAVVAGISLAPVLMRSLWPRLWASARTSLSLRTLFGPESLDVSARPSIVVLPSEVRPRWHAQAVLDPAVVAGGATARWIRGEPSPALERLLASNTSRLPGDLVVLERVERIAGRLERLHAGTGTLADALLVTRTQEGFADDFVLPPEDLQVVMEMLSTLSHAPFGEIRTASLTRLDGLAEANQAQTALSSWVEAHLPGQSLDDAFWVLDTYRGGAHARWWQEAVGRGLDAGIQKRSTSWSRALWCWWRARPQSIAWLKVHLDVSHEAEAWLGNGTPDHLGGACLEAIRELCRERDWATLLVRALGRGRPLMECVEMLRQDVGSPEAGLSELLEGRSDEEIVEAAVATDWSPLIAKAVVLTRTRPALLVGAISRGGLVGLLVRHLAEGGALPVELVRADFISQVFAGVLRGDDHFEQIARHLGSDAGPFVLDHAECDRLITRMPSDVAMGAVNEWWRRFLEGGALEGTSEQAKHIEGRELVRRLTDALAHVSHDPDAARLLATRADFPLEHLPRFSTAIEFWSKVVEEIVNGRSTLDALVVEAMRQYPHNYEFQGIQRAREGAIWPPSPDLKGSSGPAHHVGRPPSALCSDVRSSFRIRLRGASMVLVIAFLQRFPEVSEATFEDWMTRDGFRWEAGDHQRLAKLLTERHWNSAVKAFRWSWKTELTLVAWYARDLLSLLNRFWVVPHGVEQPSGAAGWKAPVVREEHGGSAIVVRAAEDDDTSDLGMMWRDDGTAALASSMGDAGGRPAVDSCTGEVVTSDHGDDTALEGVPRTATVEGSTSLPRPASCDGLSRESSGE